MRRVRSIGAVLVLAASATLLAAGPASAVEVHAVTPAADPAPSPDKRPWPPWWQMPKESSNCATAPDVDAPAGGAVGGATPSQAQGNDVSMWQTYGFAGMHWWTYDVGSDSGIGGCVPDGTAIGAASQTMIANFIFQGAQNIVSVDDMVLRLAYTSDWLGAFDPFITRSVTSLHDSVFSEWSAVALALLGLLVLIKAYKGSLTSAVTRAGSALIVLASVYLIFTQPLILTHTFEEEIDGGAGKIASAITGQTAATGAGPSGCRMADTTGCSTPLPADVMIAAIHKVMIYRVWLEGVFGDADSKTAQTYGPQILAATAMTREEASHRGTPDFAKIVEKKQADFTAIAARIKSEDPVAYTYLQGKHSEDRGSKAMRAIIGAGGASPVVWVGSFAMMMSKLMAIFILVGSMVFLLAAIVRGSFGLVQLDLVLSAAVTALVWSTALPISMLLNDAALNNPKLTPTTSALVLVLVNALVFLAAWRIAPGFSGVIRKKHARKGGKWFMSAVQAAAGFFGAHSAAAPRHQPQHAAADVVDAEVMGDEPGRHREPDLYAEDWTREPVKTGTAAKALPDAPVTPDATQTASERDDRTLPPDPRRAPEAEPKPGGDEYRPQRHEGSTTVYDIYAGRTAPESTAPESTALDAGPTDGEAVAENGESDSTDSDASAEHPRRYNPGGLSRWMVGNHPRPLGGDGGAETSE